MNTSKQEDFCRNIYCVVFNQNQSEYYGRNQSESIEVIAVDHVFEKQNCSNNNSP